MDLDQKIKRSLEIKSEWRGSTTQMWSEISEELQQKKSWWQRQQFWVSTLAAATVVLILFLQTNKPIPKPNTIAEPESTHQQTPDALPKVATFRTMLVEEPLVVKPDDKIYLTLDHWPSLETNESNKVTLSILKIEENTASESVIEKIVLNEEDLDLNNDFTVDSPTKSGTYRVVIEGNLLVDDTIHTVHAAKLIKVSTEEGR